MTPQVNSATHCEHDDTTENCGIEITPEMVRAGTMAVIKYHPEFGVPADESAVNVFRAMIEAAGHKVRISERVFELADAL